MIIGAFYLMITGFMQIGGYESMASHFSYSVAKTTIFSNGTCGLPKSDYFNLVRDVDSDFPWTGMSFGLFISSVWYWCSELVTVFFLF
jgi:hypothetical protein